MSLLTMVWVKHHYTLERYDNATPLRKNLLYSLADEADDNGLSCFPGLKTLARFSLCSVGGARQNLDGLEADGLIVIVRPAKQGRGHFNRYGLVMDSTPAATRERVFLEALAKGTSRDYFKDHPDNPQPVDSDGRSVDNQAINARKGYTNTPLTRGKGTPQTAHTLIPTTRVSKADAKISPMDVAAQAAGREQLRAIRSRLGAS